MILKISTEFSDCPGSRYTTDGNNSAEEFRDKILIPKYLECVKCNEKLIIDFDNCYGFSIPFLEEAFGGMSRKLPRYNILSNIEIISEDDVTIEKIVIKFIKDAKLQQYTKVNI